jgi:hypothetical protein
MAKIMSGLQSSSPSFERGPEGPESKYQLNLLNQSRLIAHVYCRLGLALVFSQQSNSTVFIVSPGSLGSFFHFSQGARAFARAANSVC